MGFWERFFLRHTRLKRGARPLSILLALLCVAGILAGVSLLVLPELMDALQMLAQIIGNGFLQLSHMEDALPLRDTPLDAVFSRLNIDWLSLQNQMEEWLRARSGAAVERILAAASALVNSAVSIFVGLVFAVYILSGKEKLKHQDTRLLRAWLPQKSGSLILHILSVCSEVFRRFVAGQTLEALILGSLCMLGMVILRIPYAPMVGALVGVTALVPIVGAFVGTLVGAIMILTVSPFKALLFVVFLLILQQVEGNLIYPRVVGSKLKLPAIWVLAAVTAGGNLAGPLGMLLGVPAASAGYALLREATEQKEQMRRHAYS